MSHAESRAARGREWVFQHDRTLFDMIEQSSSHKTRSSSRGLANSESAPMLLYGQFEPYIPEVPTWSDKHNIHAAGSRGNNMLTTSRSQTKVQAARKKPQPLKKPPLLPTLESFNQHGQRQDDHSHSNLNDSINRFNARHISRTGSAKKLLSRLKQVPDQLVKPKFEVALRECFQTRFWPDESPDSKRVRNAERKVIRRHKPWRLEDSPIWSLRKLSGNSLDFYETDDAMSRLFETDWQLAGHGVAKLLGSDAADPSEFYRSNAAVSLWRHSQLIYGAFDYYSAILESGSNKDNEDGEVDIFMMSYNSYCAFTRDGGLICAAMPDSALDLIWEAVNSASRVDFVQARDKWNHRRKLNRHEFLQALVRIAVGLYVATGEEADAASAIEHLCTKLEAALPAEALQDSNAFRRSRCYNQHSDMALRKHLSLLQALFSVYARRNKSRDDHLQDSNQMSIGEWLSFLEHTQLFEGKQVSYLHAKLSFKWSRIRSCPDHSARSERHLRNLTFCDFCEALTRVACLMALPTDAELEASNTDDAGEYLSALQDAGELGAFVKQRKLDCWQSEPKQHASRCITHLCSLLQRTILDDVHHSSAAAVVNDRDVIQFEKRRRERRELGHTQASPSRLDSIHAASMIVRHRLLDVLRKVELFTSLSDDQRETVCSAMSVCSYKKGEYVFDQGDEGDAFYVITDGEAEVLRRSDAASDEETALALLGEGAFFGERALIKSQVRYAGIQAKSEELFTVSITRHDLEAALGAPLEHFVPDKYRLDHSELVQCLGSVPFLKHLQPRQLKIVADRCTEVRLAEGVDIVRQGETGDAMYVITRGEADVLRWPEEGELPSDEPVSPTLLTKLGAWQLFGERALLKNERRHASVRVVSEELCAMSISRDVLEAALGPGLSVLALTGRAGDLSSHWAELAGLPAR